MKWSKVAQSCLTLYNPMDCSLPGSCVHGIFQATVLEWIAIFFSRESSRPRDRTQVSCIVDRRFTIWATREIFLNFTKQINRSFLCFQAPFPQFLLSYYCSLFTKLIPPKSYRKRSSTSWHKVEPHKCFMSDLTN